MRYREGSCTLEEIQELRQFLKDENYRPLLEDLLAETLIDPVSTDFLASPSIKEELDEVYSRVLARGATRAPLTPFRRPIWKKAGSWAVAASILALVAIGIRWYAGDAGQDDPQPLASLYGDDVRPVDDHPVLTLADGSTIALNGAKEGIVLTAEGILYTDGTDVLGRGRDDYRGMPGTADQAGSIERLVLSTPKGRQFQVTLPDQTKVWLNAATTLRYPSRFDSKRRAVELDGEAYFDVRPMASVPFVVKTKRQLIHVLGTEFNVSAYHGEHVEQLTLVEGAVMVHHPPGADLDIEFGSGGEYDTMPAGIVLAPGEQAVASERDFEVRKADISSAISWLNGRFSFDGKTFEQVMSELARWYDIEIVYEGEIPRVEFFGDAVRTTNLSTVLYLIESTKIRYRIEGRKLIIAPRKDN